jgi:beta-glucosidase
MGHSRCGVGRPARLGAIALLASITATARPSHDQPIYKDPNAPVEQRVEDLLSRMTLEEKIAQITCIWNRKQEILTPSGDFDAAKAKQVFPAGIGQVA